MYSCYFRGKFSQKLIYESEVFVDSDSAASKISIDLHGVALCIILEHIKRAKYNLESACDREAIVVAWTSYLRPQHCILKGNPFRLTFISFYIGTMYRNSTVIQI